MKRIETLISVLSLLVFLLITNGIKAAQPIDKAVIDYSKVKISLLTCSSGQEVYSLYGHTAIMIENHTNDSIKSNDANSFVVNYGLFSFSKPFFVLRFIFGLTDYEMGICDFYSFYQEYRAEGRNVIKQTLNLTDSEKAEIISSLNENYKPQNRVYRYNYFYDNCTTRARDILIKNINGRVEYTDSQNLYPSYRKLIHQMNNNSRWARLGNDLLLGVKADHKTTIEEQQFLPFNLMHDFSNAKIISNNGTERPLISETKDIVNTATIVRGSGFPLTPIQCAWLVTIIIAALTAVEITKKRNFWLLDTSLLVISGCAGIILFLMIFSQHPTTSLNFQLLLLNPIPLAMVIHITKTMYKGTKSKFWIWAIAFIVLFLICGIWQDYAEGMYVVALGLAIRCIRRLFFRKADVPLEVGSNSKPHINK